MTAVISLNHVAMVFPALQGLGSVKALEDVNFEFRDNEFVVALGASGCGKTTLLNVIAGFSAADIRPRSCTRAIRSAGRAGTAASFSRNTPCFRGSTSFRTPSSGSSFRAWASAERRIRARENLALVGLSDFENYPIYQLSGGMQQRVGLARALTCDPDMLLIGRTARRPRRLHPREYAGTDSRRWQKTRKVVFFITHSVEEALFMATRLIVMSPRPGRITHEYELDFYNQYFESGNARQVKSSAEFIAMREEILSIIYGEERGGLEP